jgi:glycosyltransferase involved in cell wall biosynthesis
VTVPARPDLTCAVVLPAYNEQAHIGEVLASLPAWVDAVFVVDDGSSDDTARVAGSTGDRRVTVLRHDRNQGVGAAMRTGYRAALEGGFDLVAKMDADGQMCPEELARLVEPFALDLADYTKGNRFYVRDAARGMPAHRSFGNTGLSFMTKLASGYWHVYDSQCGYTVVRAGMLRLIDLDGLSEDYFFENDMLIRLNALNARVVDVPTSTRYGAEVSHVRPHRVVLSFPPRLLLAGSRRFWRKHLVTDFSPIGLLTIAGMALAAFGACFGAYHWYRSIVTDHVATTGTVMIAVLPLILGAQLLVQAFSMSVAASPGAAESAAFARHLITDGRLNLESEQCR